MKEIRVLAGDNIKDKLEEAWKEVLKTKKPVTFSFNGIRVIMFSEE